jgi:2-polyprenyl-3-methyl-5-hydroxy-6-metoxy-1,4-benzoquinol methylase
MKICNYSRHSSIITDQPNLEEIAIFKDFPVFIGATEQPFEKDIKADMVWDICKDTGCIQLRHPIDPNLIYSNYHSEALGKTWLNHHKEFINFSKKYVGANILEVGGSNGSLANELLQTCKKIKKYTIVEPNPICETRDNLIVINDFFDHEFPQRYTEKYDTCIHSHTLEHSYDPKSFLKGVELSLKRGGFQIVSIPNLQRYLENKFTNTLNFEHTYFLTEELLCLLMSMFGFELVEKKDYLEHSLFFAFIKKEKCIYTKNTNKYSKNKLMFLEYLSFQTNLVEKLNSIISNTSKDVFLFGGHIFSQFLVNFGLDTRPIKGILDNSIMKNGKRLYGTNLNIFFPDILSQYESPIVLLKAGQYQDEISSQILKINSDVRII